MSIKKYFEVAESIKALSGKTADEIGSQVESVGYHEEDIIEEERFVPRVDFSNPENFARYGSAQEYYDQAIKRIYNEYPYDGSLRERLEWENNSTYIDLHIYNNQYPRTNGYAIISADGWGSTTKTAGYGLPSSLEYIFVKGGPNANPNGMSPKSTQFTGSNYYEPSKNRGSNLEFDLASQGASLEFWLNKTEFIPSLTEKEVIFDLWNGQLSSSADYLRFRLELTGAADGTDPFLLTVLSGTTGFYQQAIAASSFTTASVADSNWHHYAVTVKSASAGVTTRFYVDGNLNNESTLGSAGINDTDFADLRAYIGALITSVSGNAYHGVNMVGSGKLSGSIDELRYWKTQRTSQEIGRFWFTQVGGGVNTDPTPFTTTEESANVDLGVYFKFNEGITGIAATDSTVLDYSGRFSNGSWTGYGSNSRNTGSAIVLSNAAISEFKDPIIYSFHPDVVSLSSDLETSGSAHDVNNNASIYNSIPSWITEEDTEGTKNVKYLTQIISSYFDTLHLQLENLNHLKDIQYPSGSDKPLPFAEKLLSSYGFVAPEIFLDADVLEKLADRSEDRVYEKSLHDVKNTIYQNIYNNLNYIYKSKGTEKAFRNLIRCFGIDDELVKLNIYADNIEYELRNNRRDVIVGDKFADFNTAAGSSATVYNYTDASNANSAGFIASSTNLIDGYATTLEAEILFPLKTDPSSIAYVDTNTISSSLFGMHGTIDSGTDTTWAPNDEVNFQVYAVRDELESTNVRFYLTGTAGGYVPLLSSSLYQDVYNNKRWNLSVRIRPEEFPLKGLVSGVGTNYVVELHGVQAEAGITQEEFTVSGTVTSPPSGFVTGSRRAYVGAHRTNFTGSVLQKSDVKVNSCRYWLDFIEDEVLEAHLLDTENYGSAQPHLYAYLFNTSASYGEISKFDTLAFNWEFLNNTGSDSNGRFTVDDISSGSAEFTRFGILGNILNKQLTGRGDFFDVSSTKAINKDFVVSSKLNLPENIQSIDMVKVLNAEDQDVFTSDSRPINYFFAFEKSMYQTVSEEIINYFATMRDIHNLIGDPVERYRPEYKQMKHMRQKFFEKVRNDELDFEKFYEFYKWFDSSLSVMLGQLVPASADFAENVRVMVENHVLERPKYQNKFPFLKRRGAIDLTGTLPAYGVPEEHPPRDGGKHQRGLSKTDDIGSWFETHSPGADGLPEDEKSKWQRFRKEKSGGRSAIFDVVKERYNRGLKSPVKIRRNLDITHGGVTKRSNYKPNFVFEATQPYGPVSASSNIPLNIMLSFDIDVEDTIDTSDVFNPSAKIKLSYGMNPSINKSGSEDLNDYGKTYGPFSLYSSSVTTKYNSQVIENYKSGTMVTNLHHDFVFDTGIPAQGPFTEKFVGGRYYRHTELNDGNDTREARAEGFRLGLGLNLASSEIPIGASGALGVVPPNYPFLDSPAGSAPHGWLPEVETGQRFRDETAKRPVNIKNILMTTASVGTRLSGVLVHNPIGNYQKNYQVVQTAGRSINDPFFQDQSFTFAANPETLATRGRFPLYYLRTPAVKATGIIRLRGNPPSSSTQALQIPFLRNDGSVQNIAIFFTTAATDFSGYPTILVQRQGALEDTRDELSDALADSAFGSSLGGGSDTTGTDKVSLTQGLVGTAGNTTMSDDGSGNFVLTNFAGGADEITDTGEDNANTGGNLNYELPSRTGGNSNETVIVNRFAGCGYEVMSRGYMDPAHEELSVYNVLPYRNLSVRDYGLSGSAAADVTAGRTITITDQIGKNRGLNQRASLHAGPFGSDAAYGSVPANTYVTLPSWHKTNRNRVRRIGSASAGFFTQEVFDNLFVQHAIPRSTQQYSWVTASLAEGEIIYNNDRPSCFSASVLDKIIVSGTYEDASFAGLTTRVVDSLTVSIHTLGFSLDTDSISSYKNSDYWSSPTFDDDEDYFNVLMTTRNGPYGYPTWKQIRTGETKIARKLRETNKIGVLDTPQRLIDPATGKMSVPKGPNTFTDFFEAPLSNNTSPITFVLEDNTDESDASNNMVVTTPFRNVIDYFSHNQLNNIYNLVSDTENLTSYKSIRDFTLGSDLSAVVFYTENLYPSDTNMFKNSVRRRTSFTITNIWDDDRTKRSDVYGSNVNSQGVVPTPSAGGHTASTWPLDGHLNMDTESSHDPADGAGELLNSYGNMVKYTADKTDFNPAATYARRAPVGTSSANVIVLGGDTEWLAGEQSGKTPYESYATYAERIALVGKDHSIVPEFRISELIETYVDDNESNFLADVDNIFNLTGAAIYDSSEADFFSTYTNSDFLKYFTVIDEDLNDQRSGDLKIQRDKVSLRCNALLKFLPYKGFYPAERTLELATLFSQSHAPTAVITTGSAGATRQQCWRAALEPLYSPGIMYNTIKSGIAVNYPVLTNTSSVPTELPQSLSGNAGPAPEGNLFYPRLLSRPRFLTEAGFNQARGYVTTKIPFEALYNPSFYLNENFITGSGAIYDNGVITGSARTPMTALFDPDDTEPPSARLSKAAGGLKYSLAIDNFLCETNNFFVQGQSAFISNREDQFNVVNANQQYSMKVKIYRTLDSEGAADTETFEMYARASAFGYPISHESFSSLTNPGSPRFDHVTPPYFSGSANVTFTYTAQTTGIPTLDEIFSNTIVNYDRDGVSSVLETLSPNVSDSFNLFNFINTVPDSTTSQKKNWLIQSKFETPVLNFANVVTGAHFGYSPSFKKDSASNTLELATAGNIKQNGMWHQYGQIPTSSAEGIFAVIEAGDGAVDSDYNASGSLANIVGFTTGKPQRIGEIKKQNLLEEAVVAVPFKTVNNRRKFFGISDSNAEYDNIKRNLEKYVFPPKFDFVINDTVDPILMYAFEFSAKVTQQDIADMWQNLPPDINEKFEQKEVVIDDKQVLDLLINNSEDIQWMVFKVKRRAKKSFEKYRRSLVAEDTSAFEDNIGPYSYNWPYDYFSLVELVKIDETVQYASRDVLPDSPPDTPTLGDIS